MHIRDPIHGAIEISADERAVIDSAYFQRLRGIKQLGFADNAFPGATHSRFAHSVGAMAVATRVFDAVFREEPAPAAADRDRFRQALRLAALLHDLGHPPLSHPSEEALPPLATLGLPDWLVEGRSGRARHEDMTLQLLVRSSLGDLLEARFAPLGMSRWEAISLISGRTPPEGSLFRSRGVDYAPLLKLIVSSELDADRMDYLFRDSLHTGVNYGKFDLDWIIQNLGLTERDGRAHPTLDRRALMAFEDFLLSRYHMFMAVYFHRTSVAYELMLMQYYRERPDEYRLPADPEAYLRCDDVDLISALRRSDSTWARRIVEGRPWRAAYEVHPGDPDHADAVEVALREAGIETLRSESRGGIGRYLQGRPGFYVRTGRDERPLGDFGGLVTREADAARLVRVYVPPERLDEARRLAAGPA